MGNIIIDSSCSNPQHLMEKLARNKKHIKSAEKDFKDFLDQEMKKMEDAELTTKTSSI